ncbi:uncharacterized protein LOC129583768 isoform X2 [Paramacrobiotus metropolitanus]|uniref:uncharacterized protein LOC129583768 isoform X2 n=1 Tax=Paramacrobiotus metropolitanus TaxID=2943436 RepID=UPI0024458FFE|nr:uncharacterized protein LOC129583768 isoform X2 [Paramacrobiotus metropolitanus]
MTGKTVQNTTVVSQSVSFETSAGGEQELNNDGRSAAEKQRGQDVEPALHDAEPIMPLLQENHRKKSTYHEDYTGRPGEKRPLIIHEANFVPPDDSHELSSHYNSEFTAKPITYDRAVRPFKPYTVPSQKIRPVSNYKEDYTYFSDRIEKREPIKPQSDFIPPSGPQPFETNYKAMFCGENKVVADRIRPVPKAGEITLTDEPFNATSSYRQEFVAQAGHRLPPVKPTSSFPGLADGTNKTLPNSTYHSAFKMQSQPAIMHQAREHKVREYRAPTDKMTERSLYADDFQKKAAEKVAPIIPRSDFTPPADHVELQTAYQDTYNRSKPIQVDRKKGPSKPYTKPQIKLEGQSTYVKDFAHKEIVRRLPIIPHPEYIMPKEETKYESSYASAFAQKPLNHMHERHVRPRKPYLDPTEKMDSLSTYGNDFQAKATLPVTKVLPVKNSWFKMDYGDDYGLLRSEYKSRFSLTANTAPVNTNQIPVASS